MTKQVLSRLKRLALILAFAFGFMAVAQSAQAAVPQGGYLAGGYNETIAEAAEAQARAGVVQDCTMLVTNSLAKAGINFHGWPGDYQKLGAITYQPVRGDLIYYADGSMGVPHIAVFIGNGMAVHGGYYGATAIHSINVGPNGNFHPTYYIHVGGGPSVPPAAPAAAPAPKPVPAPAQPAIQTVAAVTPIVSGRTHVVAPGETMATIAASAGLADWHALWAANPQIADPNAIYAGQQLNLPTVAGASHVHVVAAGETLSSIAASAHLTGWQALWQANPQVANPDVITVGQQLAVP